MKKLMMQFSDALLSNEQMRALKGGYAPNSGPWIGVLPTPPTEGTGNHCYELANWGGPGGPVWKMKDCPPTAPGSYQG